MCGKEKRNLTTVLKINQIQAISGATGRKNYSLTAFPYLFNNGAEVRVKKIQLGVFVGNSPTFQAIPNAVLVGYSFSGVFINGVDPFTNLQVRLPIMLDNVGGGSMFPISEGEFTIDNFKPVFDCDITASGLWFNLPFVYVDALVSPSNIQIRGQIVIEYEIIL
jgi:hypothetical protein